jgi:SAM-dependent methyltransferase
MTAYWSKHFKNIVGIDPDKEAIKFARKNFASKNMTFKIGYAERTGLAANTLDIIICNQVYYWIPDQEDLVNEIYHILKPGGICFFGARNKYTLWDAQYYLPLLGILPKRIADKYVKLAGRADTYECRYLSYWELKKYYSRKFKIHDYTPKVIKTPSKYGYVNLAKFEGIAKHLPLGVWEAVTPVLPNFIWILEKPLK